MENLPVADPEGEVAVPGRAQVAATVTLELLAEVVRSAVEFENDSVAYEYVHPTDVGDVHLRRHTDATTTQPQTSEGLESGLGAAVH